MIRPKRLNRGDTVAVIAPASPPSDEKVNNGAKQFIEKLGLKPKICKSCFERNSYLAGSDELRASEINNAFSDPDISGIFCLRGGYGSQRIIGLLDFQLIAENPKVFVGYSDITALNILFNQMGFMTYHGPMASVRHVLFDEFTHDSLVQNIFGVKCGEISNPYGINSVGMNSGRATGILTGGNLSVIASTLGTPYEIDTRGRILFLEETNESPYKIDRMLLQLRYAKKLDVAAGFILGGFSNCVDDSKTELKDIFSTHLGSSKPVVCNIFSGHVNPMITLELGCTVGIDADQGKVFSCGR